MQDYNDTIEIFKNKLSKDTCITIGNFDGVHLGHRRLIERAKQVAQEKDQDLVVISFEPHPLKLVAPHLAPVGLSDIPTRLRLISMLGVQNVLILPFTSELAGLSPTEFVECILLRLNMKSLIVGYDFSLGKARAGNGAVLTKLSEEYDFYFEQFGPVLLDDIAISSTRVRASIREANLQLTTRLLGRFYSIHGKVVHGHKRGRTIGVPTANLDVPDLQMPPNGVYAGKIRNGIEHFNCVISVGSNPTFEGEKTTVEAHIFDYSGDLYDKDIEVFFVDKLRDQAKFNGIEELLEAIKNDIKLARAIL